MPETDNELETDQASNDGNALALVPVASAEDLQVSLNPAAAAFVFESKLCPVTYSFHPYSKMASAGGGAIHGLGRPALTLQSTALVQPKANAGTPRVYQSESRNMFVAEYERFKEVKVNLQNAFPASAIVFINFDEWVSFRVKITEYEIQQLKTNIKSRAARAIVKERVFGQGLILNYVIDASRYPRPIIPFPRSIVGGCPPAMARKPDDVYFENWSRIGHLWGDGTEPMPRTYPYDYGQEGFYKPAAMLATGANPHSPKVPPDSAMHQLPSSNSEPKKLHAPGGGSNASCAGGTATSSSNAPEYSGSQSGRPVPVTPVPGIPPSKGGYTNDQQFRSHPGSGHHQSPNLNHWNGYNNVLPPNLVGGYYSGYQIGVAYYGGGPMPQAINQNAAAYNSGYYGRNLNPQQHGPAPGAQIPNFVPSGVPIVNLQQPGLTPNTQNAKLAQNRGCNQGFQQPGFVPGGQNGSSSQGGGAVPGYIPGSTSAPAPAPISTDYATGIADPAQNAPQRPAIIGYAFASDDDYIPEDYEHEGYGEGEEGEEADFDGYDDPSACYYDLPEPIPELRLDSTEKEDSTEKGKEKAEPTTGAQLEEGKGVKRK